MKKFLLPITIIILSFFSIKKSNKNNTININNTPQEKEIAKVTNTEKQDTKTKNNSTSNKNNSPSRWWEYYLTRYLLPSIAGSFIVLWLAKPYYEYFNQSILLKESSFYIALLLLGFSYCYISSFPVLVFHATRGLFFYYKKSKKIKKTEHKNKDKKSIFLTVFLIVILSIILETAILNIQNEYELSFTETTIYHLTLAFSVIQLLIIFLSTNAQFTYLKNIAKERSKEKNIEIVESYRHLREHGNAALIFIAELILAIPCKVLLKYDIIENIDLLLLLFAIWSFPGACVYFFGQYLEYQFANKKTR